MGGKHKGIVVLVILLLLLYYYLVRLTTHSKKISHENTFDAILCFFLKRKLAF